MEGLVDGKRHMILLDLAADTSFFSEKHVNQGAWDSKNICVALGENGERNRETATVEIEL